jgi:hypothetical protein
VRRGLLPGVAAAFAFILTSAAPAVAQQPPVRKASPAAKLFEEGRRLVGEGHFAAACPKFAASKALEAGIGVSLWLADCYESNGQTASAWNEFVSTAEFAGERGDPRETIARARAEALLPRLSRIVLVPPPLLADSVQVECDGSPVPRTRWQSGLYVDPGLHHVRAKDAGRAFWEADVSVGPTSDIQSLTLPSPPVSLTVEAVPAPPLSQRPLESGGEPHVGRKIAAAASAGAGLVALGLGIYFGLEAKHDNDLSADGCGKSFCSGPAHDLRQDALNNATAADVMFAVGVGAVLGGALLYFFSRDGAESRAARTAAVLMMRPVAF